MKRFFLGIVMVSLMVGASCASWTDTKTCTASGQYGIVQIALNTYGFTLSPNYLYPGFVGNYDVQIINTGGIPVKLSYNVTSLPTGVHASATFDKTSLDIADATLAHIHVTIDSSLPPAWEGACISFNVNFIGTNR